MEFRLQQEKKAMNIKQKKYLHSRSVTILRNGSTKTNSIKINLKTQLSETKNVSIVRRNKKRNLFIPWTLNSQQDQVQTICTQIVRIGRYGTVQINYVGKIFEICQKIVDNVYEYTLLESAIKEIIQLVTKIGQQCFIFKTLAFAGKLLYQYSSLSLSLYYLDKTLKVLYMKSMIYGFQRTTEIDIYKIAAQILLNKGSIDEAKALAYRYLRKSWYSLNLEQQLAAYDFIGRIQLQNRNIQLSKYFHHRMCNGISQRPQVIKMSNMELDKIESQFQYFCSQNIAYFAKDDKIFTEFLQNHYISDALKQNVVKSIKPQFQQQNFIYTHRSLNRIIKNRHSLKRHLNHDKKSNQLHLIKQKQTKKIKKIITEYSKFVFNLDKKLQNMFVYQRFQF